MEYIPYLVRSGNQSCRLQSAPQLLKTLLSEQLTFKTPFVVILSNHERLFDRPGLSRAEGLRANGLDPISVTLA